MDPRDVFVGQVVSGRTYAEVGGLWGTINEKVSVAARAGAVELAMIDITVEDGELWTLFRKRMEDLGVGAVQCISADVCELALRPAAPEFDVVHCSGVLYHHPSPMVLLLALRRITRRHLVLTSAVTQQRIENEFGVYSMPPYGVLLVPALTEQDRRILTKYWRDSAGVVTCEGITETVAWDARNFGSWWWVPTPESMVGMCESCGFKMVAESPSWNGNAHTLLLEAK